MKLELILSFIASLLISFQIAAQDLIFRKNGVVVKAIILNSYGKSISYHLYQAADSSTYFISTTSLDSIIYTNGNKDRFNNKITIISNSFSDSLSEYNHHLIGADLAGLLFYHSLILSYEYLPGKTRIGYKVAFAKNIKHINENEFYYHTNINMNLSWSVRIGLNYYIFPPRTFRFGTGLHYVFGRMVSPFNGYFSDGSQGNKNMNGIIMSFYGFYNMNKNLAANLGIDKPVYSEPSATSVLRCEILLNF